MSLSNPTAGENPAKRRIEWDGANGYFYYYDKNVTENKGKVRLPEKLYFIMLDQLTMITGFNDQQQTGFYSNEIKDLQSEILRVKWGNSGQVAASGLYSDIKGTLNGLGAKYCKVVYAAMLVGGSKTELPNLELARIYFTGSSLSPFIEARLKDDGRVIVLGKNPEIKQKGTVKYFEPTVTPNDKRDDLIDLAREMDIELQEFFAKRVNTAVTVQNHNQEAQSVAEPVGQPLTLQPPEGFTPPPPEEEFSWRQRPQPDDEGDDLPF